MWNSRMSHVCVHEAPQKLRIENKGMELEWSKVGQSQFLPSCVTSSVDRCREKVASTNFTADCVGSLRWVGPPTKPIGQS